MTDKPDPIAQFLMDTDLTEFVGCFSIATKTGMVNISVTFEPMDEAES